MKRHTIRKAGDLLSVKQLVSVQAQRDYFGSHTYQRVDDPSGEWFHTVWSDKNSADSISTSGYNA